MSCFFLLFPACAEFHKPNMERALPKWHIRRCSHPDLVHHRVLVHPRRICWRNDWRNAVSETGEVWKDRYLLINFPHCTSLFERHFMFSFFLLPGRGRCWLITCLHWWLLCWWVWVIQQGYLNYSSLDGFLLEWMEVHNLETNKCQAHLCILL